MLLALWLLSASPPPEGAVLVLDPVGDVDPEASRALGARLTRALRAAGVRNVLGQADVVALLAAEARRQEAGCETQTCAAEIADALGAPLVITSRVAVIGGQRVWSATLLDSRSVTALGRSEVLGDGNADLLGGATDVARPLAEALGAGPGIAAMVWPGGCVVAALAVAGGGLAWDLSAPSSSDGKLDAVDLLGPAAWVAAAGLVGAAFFNPFGE